MIRQIKIINKITVIVDSVSDKTIKTKSSNNNTSQKIILIMNSLLI